MELTYSELKKRDVINISDGVCLGRITNIKLKFPEGILKGIFVPGRRSWRIFKFLNKNDLFIEDKKILKIGSDVILVNIKGGESSKDSNPISNKHEASFPCPPPCPPCPPSSCQPPCPPPCPPQACQPQSPPQPCPPPTCESLFGKDACDRFDFSDY